ncbi:MAG: hypothetical protein Q9227_005109 [Pyrenula ochraceoflavens]
MAKTTTKSSTDEHGPKVQENRLASRKNIHTAAHHKDQHQSSSSGSDEGEIPARPSTSNHDVTHTGDDVKNQVLDSESESWSDDSQAQEQRIPTQRGSSSSSGETEAEQPEPVQSEQPASYDQADTNELNEYENQAILSVDEKHVLGAPTGEEWQKRNGTKGMAITIAKRTLYGESSDGSEYEESESSSRSSIPDNEKSYSTSSKRRQDRNVSIERDSVQSRELSNSSQIRRTKSEKQQPSSIAKSQVQVQRGRTRPSDQIPDSNSGQRMPSFSNERFNGASESVENKLPTLKTKQSLSLPGKTSKKRKRDSSLESESRPLTKQRRRSRLSFSPEEDSTLGGRATGPFRKAEIDTLENFKRNFCEEYGIYETMFNECMNLTRGAKWPSGLDFTKNIMFRELFLVLPKRDKKSVLRYKDRKWRNLEVEPGQWTKAQDDELVHFVNVKGKKWAILASYLGRSADEVRQRWKNKLQNREAMREGGWTLREETSLRQAVMDAFEKIGPDATAEDLSWEGISRTMAHSRTAQQCANKWRKLVARDKKNKWLDKANARPPEGYRVQLVRMPSTSDEDDSMSSTLPKNKAPLFDVSNSIKTADPLTTLPATSVSKQQTELQTSRVLNSRPGNVNNVIESKKAPSQVRSIDWDNALPGSLSSPSRKLHQRPESQALPLSQAFVATSPAIGANQSQRGERPSPNIPVQKMPNQSKWDVYTRERTVEAKQDGDTRTLASGTHSTFEHDSSEAEEDIDEDTTPEGTEDQSNDELSEAGESDTDNSESASGHGGTEIEASPARDDSSSDSEAQIAALESPRSRSVETKRASRIRSRKKNR